MDSVKIGLFCILIICVSIGLAGILSGGEKGFEIALAALNGASLIGGWLGHAALAKKDPGQDQPDIVIPDKDKKTGGQP